jgi:hypothetical protein
MKANPMSRQTITARALCGVMIFILTNSVWAANKCVDAKGKVTYTDQPCASDAKPSTTRIKTGVTGNHAIDDVVISSSEATARGDIDALKRTAAKTDEFDKLPPGTARDQVVALLKYAAPVKVVIAARDISPDGQSAIVKATGQYRNMATEQLEPTKGIIHLQRINGDWKISKSEWGPNKW